MPLEPPPESTYATQEEAINAIKQFAISQRYMVSLIEARKTGYTRFRCDRGQKYRPSHTSSKIRRKSVSRQTGCPFQVNTHRKDGKWVVKVTNPEHNHPPSDDIKAHPLARKMSKEEMEIVKRGVSQGLAPRVIMAKLHEFNPNTMVKPEDVYNTRAGMRQRKMVGLSPVQQLRFRLKVSGYQYRFHQDEEGHVQRVFFAHPKSIQYVQRFPEAFTFEVEKKTNRYMMPLVAISGITASNSVFPAAFAFVREDDIDNYVWVLEQFLALVYPQTDEAVESDALPQVPPVVAVPGNPNLQKSIHQVVPHWTVLASWPSCKAEAFDVALRFEPEEDRQKLFVETWDQVLSSTTPEQYESRVGELHNAFEQQSPDLVNYLEQSWLSAKERLVRAWIDQYMHFGIIFRDGFLGAEGFLLSSTGDLLDAFVRIENAIKANLRKVSVELEYSYNARVTLDDVSAQLLEGMVGRISKYALDLVVKEYKKAKNRAPVGTIAGPEGSTKVDTTSAEQPPQIEDSAVDPQVVDTSLAAIGAEAEAVAVAAVETAAAVAAVAAAATERSSESADETDISITMGLPSWKIITERLEEPNGQLYREDFHKHWDIDSTATDYADDEELRDPVSPEPVSDAIDTALQGEEVGRTRCSLCRGVGHNSRRCPRKDELGSSELQP